MDRFSPRIFFEGLRPTVDGIDNFYLTGQDVSISSLAGALCGAYCCTAKILGKLDPFSILREVQAKQAKQGGDDDQSHAINEETICSYTTI